MSADGRDLDAQGRAWRQMAPWLSAAWQLTVTAVLGVGAGWWVDGRFETKPFGLLVGGLVGSGLGLAAFIRASLKAMEKKP